MMNKERVRNRRIFSAIAALIVTGGCYGIGADAGKAASVKSEAVVFATDGQLKMLYDERVDPAAIEYNGRIYIAWRGAYGLPQARTYDLDKRTFSEQVSILDGFDDVFDLDKYYMDHQYVPALWMDNAGHVHIIAGCHGNRPSSYSDCDKVRTRIPDDIYSGWEKVDSVISRSVNYPTAYPVYDDQRLIHFRDTGHLGSWTYRLSPDGEQGWHGPEVDVVDLNFGADPAVSCRDFHSGSYHSVRISKDGKTLHDVFVGTLQDFGATRHSDCVAPVNNRYKNERGFQQRYNLYYIKVDLPTGRVVNHVGKQLTTPVTRRIADAQALIHDTDERLFATPPAIYLDENDHPFFLGTVSEETPYRSWFTFFQFKDDGWKMTKVARTSHYWNAGMLDKDRSGAFRALLIVGDGEAREDSLSIDYRHLNRYGWGTRIEEWLSKDGGETWVLNRDITPRTGHRYQAIKRVSTGVGAYSNEIFLFYGWKPDAKPGEAIAFLWDDR